MTSTDTAPLLIFSLLAGPVLGIVVLLLLSRLSGWKSLAARYATHQIPHGIAYSMQSGRVGAVSYRHCLNVQVGRDGLFLSVLSIFRLGHAPLFIPWSAIGPPQPVRILWYKAVRVAVGHPPIAFVELPPAVLAARPASG